MLAKKNRLINENEPDGPTVKLKLTLVMINKVNREILTLTKQHVNLPLSQRKIKSIRDWIKTNGKGFLLDKDSTDEKHGQRT